MIKVASQIINEKDAWFNFRSGDYQVATREKLMLDLMLHPKMNFNWIKNLKSQLVKIYYWLLECQRNEEQLQWHFWHS